MVVCCFATTLLACATSEIARLLHCAQIDSRICARALCVRAYVVRTCVRASERSTCVFTTGNRSRRRRRRRHCMMPVVLSSDRCDRVAMQIPHRHTQLHRAAAGTSLFAASWCVECPGLEHGLCRRSPTLPLPAPSPPVHSSVMRVCVRAVTVDAGHCCRRCLSKIHYSRACDAQCKHLRACAHV